MLLWHKLFTIVVLSGSLTYYNPGVMDEVYTNRILYRQITPCPDCIGQVAVLDCRYLNDIAALELSDGTVLFPLHVIDCAAQQHYAMLQKRGLIGEVDWQTSRQIFTHNRPLTNVTLYLYNREILDASTSSPPSSQKPQAQ